MLCGSNQPSQYTAAADWKKGARRHPGGMDSHFQGKHASAVASDVDRVRVRMKSGKADSREYGSIRSS